MQVILMWGVLLNRGCMYTDWVFDTQRYTTCEGPPYPICTAYKYDKYENPYP